MQRETQNNFFQSVVGDFGEGLHCPACDQPWLHHDKVQVFERMEDEQPIVVTVDHPGIVTTSCEKSADSNNPSDRRNGLLIEFWCEQCDHRPVLKIWQHKGCTQMSLT